MCKPIIEGGIGTRLLKEFNEAGLMKLAWEFMKKDKHWACFLQARFYARGYSLNYYKSSLVWGGIKQALLTLTPDLAWCIGFESVCILWDDDWTPKGILSDVVVVPDDLNFTCNMKIRDFIQN